MSNFHSHCTFCDGRSAPAEFARFAIANHFRAYGFSSHAPLPFETFWNMTKDDMPEYLQEIGRLKDKHKEQLEIYVGLEIDYLDPTYNASIPYFRALPLDYRIGSIHFLPLAWPLVEKNMMCIDGSYEEFAHSVDQHYQGDIRLLVGHYFRSLREMLEAGGIDIVGHMDKIFMNGQRYKGFDMTANWYLDPLMDCLELVKEKGYILEINTKNWVKRHETYPHVQHLKAIRELDIPIMVNSDCHYPTLVNDGRKEILELLREQGFKCTRELVKGQWEDLPL